MKPPTMRSPAQLLGYHSPTISKHWLEQVSEHWPDRQPLLQGHLPGLLRELAAALERAHQPAETAADVASERARHPDGFDLEQVVHEYSLLRNCVLDVFDAEQVALPIDEIRALTHTFSGALVRAVSQHAAQIQETERRNTEQVHASEAELRLVTNALPFPISFVSSDERYALVNKAYEDWFGLPNESLVGRRIVELIGDAAYAVLSPPIKRALGGERFSFEQAAVPYRLGGTRDIRVWFVPRIAASGSVVGYVALLQDITAERRAAADLQRQSEALHEANQAKDEFLATASHELRTPLNAILGWARMLRSGHVDASAYTRGLETIERNAKAQVQLIEDILDGSRIITGKLHLEIRPLDMTALVQAALDAVRPAAHAKGIGLSLGLDPAAARVVGDPERLQQVVWNLANNAVKFTPKGGTVAVRLERSGTSIELSVADSGQGIDADFLPFVFDRFRQAEGSTTRRHGGLGLGLALVRHLVEAHGGTVRAESAGEGQGARFVVLLPVQAVFQPEVEHAAHLAPVAPNDDAPDRLAGVSVLVVDDEADARELVATVLRASGAEVRIAAGAAQALTELAKGFPKLIISDIGMPQMDGYELLRRVRSSFGSKGAEIPAIALTAYSREQDRRLALEAGFQTHVSKPVEPAELVRVAASLVRFLKRQSSSGEPGGLERADAFLKFEKVLHHQGIHESLRFLNNRTSHRFTGIFRFAPPRLESLFLVDSDDPRVKQGDDAQLSDTYCSIVGVTQQSLTTEDTRRDERLSTHPARRLVLSYCGVLLRGADGETFGTLCHFDRVPSDVPVSEMPLLEAAAPLLMVALLRA